MDNEEGLYGGTQRFSPDMEDLPAGAPEADIGGQDPVSTASELVPDLNRSFGEIAHHQSVGNDPYFNSTQAFDISAGSEVSFQSQGAFGMSAETQNFPENPDFELLDAGGGTQPFGPVSDFAEVDRIIDTELQSLIESRSQTAETFETQEFPSTQPFHIPVEEREPSPTEREETQKNLSAEFQPPFVDESVLLSATQPFDIIDSTPCSTAGGPSLNLNDSGNSVTLEMDEELTGDVVESSAEEVQPVETEADRPASPEAEEGEEVEAYDGFPPKSPTDHSDSGEQKDLEEEEGADGIGSPPKALDHPDFTREQEELEGPRSPDIHSEKDDDEEGQQTELASSGQKMHVSDDDDDAVGEGHEPEQHSEQEVDRRKMHVSDDDDDAVGEGHEPEQHPEQEVDRRKMHVSDDDDDAVGEGHEPEQHPEQEVDRRKLHVSDDDDEVDLDEGHGHKPEPEQHPEQEVEKHSEVAGVPGIVEDEEEEDDEEGGQDDGKAEVGELIADIFGESDEEGESDDEKRRKQAPSVGREETVEGEDDEDQPRRPARDFQWDFDLMLEQKKIENRKRRRRRKDGTVDLLSDADEQIKEMVYSMKEAAERDRTSNTDRLPALKKRKMLPYVLSQLRKADLQEAYIDFGVIEALSEWLAPLPDKSLPSLEIRTNLLKMLHQFPKLDQSVLRRSGIGKAVMLLFKHPKETKENKQMSGRLISDWSRPIFELDTDYRALSKKDREERDYQNMPMAKKRRLSMEAGRQETRNEDEERPLRPGDKGWIGRARVPQPSTKDYVVRPKWKVEGQFRGTSNKKSTVYDKKLREFKEKSRSAKHQHAVGISIEGRKMSY